MRQILQENVFLEFSEKEKTAFHRLQMFRFLVSSRKGRLVSALMFEVTGLGLGRIRSPMLLGKTPKLERLEEVKVVTRFP